MCLQKQFTSTSVDESFIDLNWHRKVMGDPVQTVKRIQDEIFETLNLPSTAGMGPNMLMAKLALDLEAKKTGFAKWTFEDVPTKLWPVSPLSEMWGIGRQTEKTLNNMGIYSVGDLAHAELTKSGKEIWRNGKPILSSRMGHRFVGAGCSNLRKSSELWKGQTLYGIT